VIDPGLNQYNLGWIRDGLSVDSVWTRFEPTWAGKCSITVVGKFFCPSAV